MQKYIKPRYAGPILEVTSRTPFPPTMTLFFTIVAALHLFGLFAMLLALRGAPVSATSGQGFRTITEPEQASEAVVAHARVRTA